MSNFFVDSAACQSRSHCKTCRSLEGGRAFRISIGHVKKLPADAPDFACPHGIEWESSSNPTLVTGVPIMEVLGPALWREIHTETEPTPEFVANIAQRLPCGPCRVHWIEVLRTIPPVYGDGYFGWSVDAHNAVNRLIGKPEVPLAEARGKWE